MLKRISIKGFKSLRNVENLELGLVNVFVGANGSGKTNLLEALGVLSAAVAGPVDDQALLRRGVRLSPTHLYQSSFQQTAPSEKIRIHTTWRFDKDNIDYHLEFDSLNPGEPQPYRRELFINDRQVEEKYIPTWRNGWIDIKGSGHPPPEELTQGLVHFEALADILGRYAIYSPDTPTLRGRNSDITQRDPIGLAGGRLAEAIGDLLKMSREQKTGAVNLPGGVNLDDWFDLLDWVDDITTGPPSHDLVSGAVPTLREIVRFTDQWMAAGDNQLSAYDASEGALYVLFALVLVLHPRSPYFFAIDNFDQAMHPRLARATTRLFCQEILEGGDFDFPTLQALLTTHNPLVLDGLDLRDDRIRLFAVERGSKGDTQIHRVQVSEEILEATQEGLSLSNLWIMGRLGGVPDIF